MSRVYYAPPKENPWNELATGLLGGFSAVQDILMTRQRQKATAIQMALATEEQRRQRQRQAESDARAVMRFDWEQEDRPRELARKEASDVRATNADRRSEEAFKREQQAHEARRRASDAESEGRNAFAERHLSGPMADYFRLKGELPPYSGGLSPADRGEQQRYRDQVADAEAMVRHWQREQERYKVRPGSIDAAYADPDGVMPEQREAYTQAGQRLQESLAALQASRENLYSFESRRPQPMPVPGAAMPAVPQAQPQPATAPAPAPAPPSIQIPDIGVGLPSGVRPFSPAPAPAPAPAAVSQAMPLPSQQAAFVPPLPEQKTQWVQSAAAEAGIRPEAIAGLPAMHEPMGRTLLNNLKAQYSDPAKLHAEFIRQAVLAGYDPTKPLVPYNDGAALPIER
jgi:hypothetical protein